MEPLACVLLVEADERRPAASPSLRRPERERAGSDAVRDGGSAIRTVVADEIVRLVKALGGLNRYRFANDPDLLAQWESASSVVAGRRAAGEKPEGDAPAGGAGDVRPAA